MTCSIGKWGISVQLGGLAVWLYLGDVYLRCPKVGELAWNTTGLHLNRLPVAFHQAAPGPGH